jgi:hypothetical protein
VNIPVRFQNSFPGNLEYDIYNRETNRITICLVDIWSPTTHPFSYATRFLPRGCFLHCPRTCSIKISC